MVLLCTILASKVLQVLLLALLLVLATALLVLATALLILALTIALLAQSCLNLHLEPKEHGPVIPFGNVTKCEKHLFSFDEFKASGVADQMDLACAI